MNQIDLAGETAIVTGAARGIGFAVASRLLRSGAKVALWDRDADALAVAESQLSPLGPVATATMDVTSLASIRAALAATEARLDGVSLLVNNAGIAGANKPSWELDEEEWRQVVDIDL